MDRLHLGTTRHPQIFFKPLKVLSCACFVPIFLCLDPLLPMSCPCLVPHPRQYLTNPLVLSPSFSVLSPPPHPPILPTPPYLTPCPLSLTHPSSSPETWSSTLKPCILLEILFKFCCNSVVGQMQGLYNIFVETQINR